MATAPLTSKDKMHMAKARKEAVPLDTLSPASSEVQELVPLQQQNQRLTARVNTGVFLEHYFNQRHPLVAKRHPKTKKGKEALAAEKGAVHPMDTPPDP